MRRAVAPVIAVPRVDHLSYAGVRLRTKFLVFAIAALVPGCGVIKERVCRRGEYAARAISAPETGRVCVPNGEEPPSGYERFPPGETPTYTRDDR
jgi:hypothetical protein